ncbi:MAG: hypothetical protein AB1445_08075 [Bacillota bacterium]
MTRRALWLSVLLCLLVLAAIWLTFGFRRDSTYVFLHVIESNTHGLARLPPGEFPPVAHFDPGTCTLWVTGALPRKSPIIILYEVDALGIRLHARLHALRPGATLRISEPRSWTGSLSGAEVIADQERLFRRDLRLVRVEPDGTVQLECAGSMVRLSPGEGWSWAVLEPGGVPVEAMPGPEWEEVVRQAFAANQPLTRLTVFNYGRWEWSGVKAGGPW